MLWFLWILWIFLALVDLIDLVGSYRSCWILQFPSAQPCAKSLMYMNVGRLRLTRQPCLSLALWPRVSVVLLANKDTVLQVR